MDNEIDYSSKFVIFVNGSRYAFDNPDPSTTLLTFLRLHLRLSGTKLGCGEGGCGACTVMVSKFDHQKKEIKHFSVNACLAPLCAFHGMAVTTVEGIGSTKTKLHPVQERIAKAHGSQCGFCTPGIVMSMYTLLRSRSVIKEADFETAFQGNLCRCTGYRPILEGYKTFLTEKCCGGKSNGGCCMTIKNDKENVLSDYRLFDPEEFTQYDPTQEPIFPNELQINEELHSLPLKFVGKDVTWYRPTSLSQLLRLKHEHTDAKILVGNTEIGVEVKFKHAKYPLIICASHIVEMQFFKEEVNHIECGSAVSLTNLDDHLKRIILEGKDANNDNFKALREMLHWFAGPQIRNVAAIGGNIMTASPISDLIPVLVAQEAELKFKAHGREVRAVRMDQNLFPGYRRIAADADEVLLSVSIPRNKLNEFMRAYKQAHRREDDIAIVNAGIRVQFHDNCSRIKLLRLCFGGMAPTCVLAKSASSQFVNREWDAALLSDVLKALEKDLPLPFGVPGGSEAYRRSLALSFFFRFFVDVSNELEKRISGFSPALRDSSAVGLIKPGKSEVGQLFELVPPDQPITDPIGRPIPHISAFKQATGEATYVDDMPHYESELYMALVYSQRAHAKITKVDPSAALSMDGVEAFVDHNDVVGSKTFLITRSQEPTFPEEKVEYLNQPIAAVLAHTQDQAQAAARAVLVTYEDLTPVITIEEALAVGRVEPHVSRVECGDVDGAFSQCDVIVEGEVRTGAQEQFYLETHGCLAVPREDNEMCVYSSTQNPTGVQIALTDVLGVPRNRVEVKVKRIGGGFGGKETRSIPLAVWTAIAARKMNRPVRIVLDRDEDMALSGTRHPSLTKYKVGATKDGKLVAIDEEIYLNAGFSNDLSSSVVNRSLESVFASYHVPNVRGKGFICFTNLPSNTAFRGFGIPQSCFAAEAWIVHIAKKLRMSPEEVREKNLFRSNDPLPMIGQTMPNSSLEECWKKCLEISDFETRKRECETFNKQNRWKKRGVSVTTVAYPCAFPVRCLNQSGALIHVYLDGSVLLSHGGVEMGQGLHSKCAQVASRALGIPLEQIYIAETATDKIPNTSASAASFSSDLNCGAVLNACEQIQERLKPFIAANPNGQWKEWIDKAYVEGVSLSATGFFFEPNISTYISEDGRMGGRYFAYFSFGAGFSEVEIDCLTGDHVVQKVHLVMDVGSSLNPAIDIGQIEGAFMQGYGLLTLEETRHSPQGFLFTRGPGAYKIPAFGNIPSTFTVHILHGRPCESPFSVYSSKAVGEPPLLLSLSTFCAIREAIAAARRDENLDDFFRLDCPASCERIRMACVDNITKRFPEPPKGSYQPWDVQL